MLLSEKDLDEFQVIRRVNSGNSLTTSEAHDQAIKLLTVVDLLAAQREPSDHRRKAVEHKIVSGSQ
jgi:hypothetical protein